MPITSPHWGGSVNCYELLRVVAQQGATIGELQPENARLRAENAELQQLVAQLRQLVAQLQQRVAELS